MTVLPGYPGLVVEILVDGAPLQEYDNDEDDDGSESPGTITKYIEASSGATFTIRYTIPEMLPRSSLSKQVYLDGNGISDNIEEWWLPEIQYLDEGPISKIAQQTVCQKYQFAKMNISKFSICLHQIQVNIPETTQSKETPVALTKI